MLAMAAFQFGHPVLLFVLMKSNYALVHAVDVSEIGFAEFDPLHRG